MLCLNRVTLVPLKNKYSTVKNELFDTNLTTLLRLLGTVSSSCLWHFQVDKKMRIISKPYGQGSKILVRVQVVSAGNTGSPLHPAF